MRSSGSLTHRRPPSGGHAGAQITPRTSTSSIDTYTCSRPPQVYHLRHSVFGHPRPALERNTLRSKPELSPALPSAAWGSRGPASAAPAGFRTGRHHRRTYKTWGAPSRTHEETMFRALALAAAATGALAAPPSKPGPFGSLKTLVQFGDSYTGTPPAAPHPPPLTPGRTQTAPYGSRRTGRRGASTSRATPGSHCTTSRSPARRAATPSRRARASRTSSRTSSAHTTTSRRALGLIRRTRCTHSGSGRTTSARASSSRARPRRA
jgi:hypothetical protein